MGHGASMSLYDFANGDPVNSFDPDGRLATKAKNLGSQTWNAAKQDGAWLYDTVSNAGLMLVQGLMNTAAIGENMMLTGLPFGLETACERQADELNVYRSPMERAGAYQNNQFTAALQEMASVSATIYVTMKPSPTTPTVGTQPAAAPVTFNPANFADDVARIRADSLARYGSGEGVTAMAVQTTVVDLSKVVNPVTRPFADPIKLARQGPFDLSKYTPAWATVRNGAITLENGVTRIENARQSGVTHLPIMIFKE